VEGTRDFPADSWRLGKMDTRIFAWRGERGCTDGALRTAWKLRIDKNAKTSRKKTCGGAQRSKIRSAGSDDYESNKSIKHNSHKKDLSPEQREDLLGALKARFEKNMNRHKGLEWPKYKQSWKLVLKNCGHSMKWKELAVNRRRWS